MRVLFVAFSLLLTLTCTSAAQASFPCRGPSDTYNFRAQLVGCETGRAVYRAYVDGDDAGCFDGQCRVYARARNWQCSARILRTVRPVPGTAPIIEGRILCAHVANRGRFVRWYYHGQGA